jgi:hypothetical protein
MTVSRMSLICMIVFVVMCVAFLPISSAHMTGIA